MKAQRLLKNNSAREPFSNIEKWELNRRLFVKALSVSAVLSQMTLVSSCSEFIPKVYQGNQYVTALEAEIIQKVQLVLFPDDANGPSAEDINAYSHLIWVLSDVHKDQESIDYIKKGLRWTEETAQENYGKTFSLLSEIEVNELVAFMAERNWGASWLSMLLTLIFEALAMDPIYNVNVNKAGWKWLKHEPGQPRPNKENGYTNIFKCINEN